MATRKRYVAVEQSPVKDAPATAATPVQAAEPPPPVTDKQPAEPLMVESSPVEEATRNALGQRLQEVERADQLQREAIRQQPRMAAEPQQPVDPIEQAIATAPERVKRWYRANPQFLVDPEKAAQLNYCHFVACREVGEEGHEAYYDRME